MLVMFLGFAAVMVVSFYYGSVYGKDIGYQKGFVDGINAKCNAEEILEMIGEDDGQ